MILEYKIYEQDFLDFQLFAASQSERIKKKKKTGWIILTAGSAICFVYFFLEENMAMIIYFGILVFVFGIFYPKYFAWRYKKHYRAHIKEHYINRVGQQVNLELKEGFLFSKDKVGESKINLSEIEKVDETGNHFFLKASTGVSLIIPKKELQNLDEVRAKLISLGLNVNDLKNWVWK